MLPNRRLEESLRWLYGTQLFGVKLGLEGVGRLAKEMGVGIKSCGWGGSEHERSGPVIVHVAGTNGKGSTSAMVASMCVEAGLRTGLYTSPHLVSVQERFRFDDSCISEEELSDGLERIRDSLRGWDPHPTFFEILTVLALDWFRSRAAQVIVLETGLGGRLDATNIVEPAVSVLTPVSLDHQQYLGAGLEQIALEKAGIIKSGVPVVAAAQKPEVHAVFDRIAREKGCALEWVTEPWTGGPIGLRGRAQLHNAALAVAAVKAANLGISPTVQQSGLARVKWPGRFQQVVSDLVVDGAHNPEAAEVLARTWAEVFPGERATLIFGVLEDKDAAGVLMALAPLAAEVVLTPVSSPRAIPTGRLHKLVKALFPALPCIEVSNLEAALARPSKCRRLVAGSLYLVGEVLSAYAGRKQERSAQ